MLTKREIEFCNNFIKYAGNELKISEVMGISWCTANTHKNNIFNKLLVDSKVQLMHYLFTNNDWDIEQELFKNDI